VILGFYETLVILKKIRITFSAFLSI
jgi:hypothetical protein